ncbi:MAG: YceD family protein [Candidatus Bipolaricaulaceae bacterium]
MRLDLSELRASPGRPVQLSAEEALGRLEWWGQELALNGPVRADVLAFYQQERVFLSLRVRGGIHRPCSRCLRDTVEEFDHTDLLEVRVGWQEQYLELRPHVEAGVRLALSPRPLCRPSCRGICPHCGADLNREDHRADCRPPGPAVDPRLAKLKELL